MYGAPSSIWYRRVSSPSFGVCWHSLDAVAIPGYVVRLIRCLLSAHPPLCAGDGAVVGDLFGELRHLTCRSDVRRFEADRPKVLIGVTHGSVGPIAQETTRSDLAGWRSCRGEVRRQLSLIQQSERLNRARANREIDIWKELGRRPVRLRCAGCHSATNEKGRCAKAEDHCFSVHSQPPNDARSSHCMSHARPG